MSNDGGRGVFTGMAIFGFTLVVGLCTIGIVTLWTWPEAQLDRARLKRLLVAHWNRYSHNNDNDNNDNDDNNDSDNDDGRTQPLRGVRVVVTGPTAGIGLALVKILYEEGATVLAIGRSESRLRHLQSLLTETTTTTTATATATKTATIRFRSYVADLEDLDAVASAANRIVEDFDRLDFLVNNAGMNGTKGTVVRTKQGYEQVFAVNYMAHYLLTEKLLPLLRRSTRAPRVVYVSSNLHRGVTGTALMPMPTHNDHDNDDPQPPVASGQQFTSLPNGNHIYANAKFAQLLHAHHHNRGIYHNYPPQLSPVPILATCPGAVRTAIHKDVPSHRFFFDPTASTWCIWQALFATTTTTMAHTYFKNIPTLACLRPPRLVSSNDRHKYNYLFVVMILTMPFQHLLFTGSSRSRSRRRSRRRSSTNDNEEGEEEDPPYTERSDPMTYDRNLQEQFMAWSRREIQSWL